MVADLYRVFGHLWRPSQPHQCMLSLGIVSLGAEWAESWILPGLGFCKDSMMKGERGPRDLLHVCKGVIPRNLNWIGKEMKI